MPDHLTYRLTTPAFLFLSLLAGMAACGLLGSDDQQGGLLSVTPISAVEVFLEVRAFPGAEISIDRDDEVIYSFRMSRADTLLTDSGLLPATDYRWTAVTKNGLNRTETRRAATLDTTSQEFTWQTFTFGEHSSSVLRGVSIIDENNIWAVGEIYMNDSTGQSDSDRYNAIHWEGNEWSLERISVQFRDRFITPNLNGIVSFSPSDIWLSSGVPIHGDGVNWTQYHLFDMGILDDSDGGIESIWGKNSENMFFGGALGSIVHYNGQNWQNIETGTDLDFYDIHGNEEQGVVAIAAKRSESSDKAILRIKEDFSIESLPTTPIPFSISGIWFDPSGVTYVVGTGIFLKSNIKSSMPWQPIHHNIANTHLRAIDANGLNDIVMTGDFGEFLHFNGAEWTSFRPQFEGILLIDVTIKGNQVVAVGTNGQKAFIITGKRE